MARHSELETDAQPAGGRLRRRRGVLAWCLLAGIIFVAAGGAWVFADWWSCLPDDVQASYVGRQACADCHASETQQWVGSDHDRAMDRATDETVLADFDNAELTHHGITSRMFRRDGKFMIHTEGPDGKMADFEIKYVFGVRPLQQYMVEFDRPADMPDDEIARLQVLRISWDTQRKHWFYMPPPDVPEKLSPDDDLHWTGVAQRWNNMCAYCHSTNLQKNFDVDTLTYHTTFSEIDVSCEACHGPGSIHVQLAQSESWFWDRKRGYGLARLKTQDTRAEIQTCAPCHSRRQMLYPHFRPADNYYDFFNNELLEEATYYADGQIKDEDYVFGSFIQSKMYHKDIRCSDCHNPHSVRLKHDGNQVCTSCHQHPAAKYDSPAHHFHKSNSTGAACAECHMPETTYMEVDPRRDHSIRIPRPDLSVQYGLPNACTRCHLTDAKIPDEKRAKLHQYRDWMDAARHGDKQIADELARLDRWSADYVKRWYKTPALDAHYATVLLAGRQHRVDAAKQLAALARDRHFPGIVRATAIHQRGYLPSVDSLQPELAALQDDDPQVRAAGIDRFYDQIPNVGSGRLAPQQESQLVDQVRPIVRALVPLLADPRRSVRAQAGRVLARVSWQLLPQLLNGVQREALDRAVDEYIAGVHESNDRGGAHMALGVLYESMGKDRQAEEAYRTALRVEPRLTGPRSNLAALLERAVEQEMQRFPGAGPSEDALARQQEVKKLRRGELELLARDARLLPESPGIQYRYGLALYLQGEQEKALTALTNACRLDPDNDQFLLALALFHEKYEQYDKAARCAARLLELRPGDPRYVALKQQIDEKQRGTEK